METLAQIYAKHSGPGKFNDKGTTHSYIDVYEELLAPYRKTAGRVLEIGLFDGHSMRMWEDYFSNARVCGVDCSDRPHGGMADLRPMINEKEWRKSEDRTYLYQAHDIRIFDATDRDRVFFEFNYAGKFDVIIDDAAHEIQQQLKLYDIFKDHISKGGIYIVEDIQDIDQSRSLFEALGFEIIDRRKIKNRFDDVLAVMKT